MPTFMTREEFDTPEGHKAAWRSLMLEDHGFLRKVYDNSHRIGDGMWRTYQPSPKDLETWVEKHGVRTVINLRGLRNAVPQPGFYWLEEEKCRELGIELVNFRAFSREAPTADFLLDIDALFRRIDYPAIMHCKSGADRAGIASTLYLFLKEEKPLAEALKMLTYRYGHVKTGKTGVLDHFFDVYRLAAEKDGIEPNRTHFLNWVREDYVRDEVTQSFRAGMLGSLLTEKILRRE
ncbi:hypothetical protein [Parvularcula sp. LCG005]|uniref:hypothetical protein n=1 Tax=Parvularcula sp. LCG005 TaxID=3078805 RepID=UPI00294288D5|nr:hypothetical protein [Parvularcula sp. LCG005]WOI52794.1 hypothetical protein RUI03_11615 [Parvularcula sp. LCG005]